jgi:hypothetical protein
MLMKSTLKPNCLKCHVKGKVLAENRMQLNTDTETKCEIRYRYQPTTKHINTSEITKQEIITCQIVLILKFAKIIEVTVLLSFKF